MRPCVFLFMTPFVAAMAAGCVARPAGTATVMPASERVPATESAPVAPALPETEVPSPVVPLTRPLRLAPQDRACLATAMYYEARGEGDDGMMAVGHVVFNRLRERPPGTTVCDVVYERGQFGWTRRVSRKRVAIGRTLGWKTAAALADRLVAGKSDDLTGGATSFYSVLEFVEGPPSWAEAQQETARIGNHVFIVP